jgi:hypothetical protein
MARCDAEQGHNAFWFHAVDSGFLAQLPGRGLTRCLTRLACSSWEFPLLSPTVEHHECGVRVLDHDHGRRNGHPIVQALCNRVNTLRGVCSQSG